MGASKTLLVAGLGFVALGLVVFSIRRSGGRWVETVYEKARRKAIDAYAGGDLRILEESNREIMKSGWCVGRRDWRQFAEAYNLTLTRLFENRKAEPEAS
jgi:hypothetical protein